MNSQAVCWVWVGLIIGVSFIATPAKFNAPSLGFPEALDVGRATFNIFRWAELFILLSIILFFFFEGRRFSSLPFYFLAMVSVLLIINYIFIQPLLDIRVQKILDGEILSPSILHHWYVFFELIKLFLLISISWMLNK